MQFIQGQGGPGFSIDRLPAGDLEGIDVRPFYKERYSENRVGVSRNDAFKSTRASASGDLPRGSSG
jgi:hypothetical protein